MMEEDSNVDREYSNGDEQEQEQKKKKNFIMSEKLKTNKVTEKKCVAYHKLLFSFSDSVDHLLMLVGTISAIGNGICQPLMALLLGELANASFGNSTTSPHTTKQDFHQVCKVCLKFVYLALVNGLAAFFQMSCWAITGERQAARIRSLYLRSILRQEIGFFDNQTNSGEIISTMSGDTFLVQEAIGEKVVTKYYLTDKSFSYLLQQSLISLDCFTMGCTFIMAYDSMVGKSIQLTASFLGGFVIAFTRGRLLTLVMLSSIPPIVVSTSLMFVLLTKLTSRAQTAYSQAGTIVEQTLTSIKTVASFTGEMRAIEKYGESLHRVYKSGVQAGLATGLGAGACIFFLFSSYALALWFGAKMIIKEDYNGGPVINVIVAMLSGSYSMGQASPCLSTFSAGQTAAFKMFETIRRKPEIDPYDNNRGMKLEDGIKGDIELKDVDFSYPSRPDELVFRGFSLAIPRGAIAALVGPSGSGKSTVINLIERFYEPQSGEVLIDGIDVKNFNLGWIRGKIGLVSQEPMLFTSSIRDNIAYGKDGASLEEIKSAVMLANASKFIDKLPQGLETMVGEHGTQLSGGQKQRIAIARAILKEPRILLLDEATSALDAKSERVVQQALDRVMMNCTTIIVAHRLGTVKNADMIAVIHQGRIIEKGSHAELVEDPEGAYCQLIRLQQMSTESEGKIAAHDHQYEPEKCVDSQRHSSRHISTIVPSSKLGLSENGNSSHHSFSISLPIDAKDKMGFETKKARPEVIPIGRLAHLNKPEIPVLLVGSIAVVINGLIQPLFGLAFSSMIKIFYEPVHELRKDSEFWALVFAGLGAMSLLAISTKRFCFAVAGCRLIKRIRLMCFEKVVHMDISWFEEGADHMSGAIGARLSTDATLLQGLVGDMLALLIQSSVAAIAGLVIAFQASWLLAIINLVVVPFVGLSGYLPMKYMGGFSTNAKKLHEEASQVAGDAVGGIRTVASFCAEERVMRLYEAKCKAPIKAGIRQGLTSGAVLGLSSFLMYPVYAISFYAGSRLVEAGKVDFAQVFQVFFVLSMTTMNISSLIGLCPDSSKAKIAVASIFKILDSESKINSSDDSGRILDSVKGDIELRHVSFKYPARPDVQIFRDLCLSIPAGKVVALVGESGSGKSTVISLLLRFYDPDSGVIELDGIDVRSLNLKWLRQQMGVVSQEPILFNETIRANISYGKAGDATEAEIIAAAELANAHNFISSLQQGYETIVGERGIQLSGGQKQRVAIARAIVKSPKILLLDEATSALDAESEKVVQDALDQIMVDRTTVVVAHRLSTIKDADLIAVVKNGHVVEKGKHDALMNMKDGVYASLVALQTSDST